MSLLCIRRDPVPPVGVMKTPKNCCPANITSSHNQYTQITKV